MIFAAVIVAAMTTPVTDRDARAAATRFCEAVVSHDGFSYDEFTGRARSRMQPLISTRLLRMVDEIRDCGRDWSRHQPAHSTDKPPFVDCCVFSGSPDWNPTGFTLLRSVPLADGRRKVIVEYRYDSKSEHGRWQVALDVVNERGRYVVDDFEGAADAGSRDCKDGKWISGY